MRLSLTKSFALPVSSKSWTYGILISLVAMGIAVAVFLQPDSIVYLSAGWLVIVALLVWLGNRLMTRIFDRILPWERWSTVRFFIHLCTGLLYLLILVNLSYLVLKVSLTPEPPTQEQFIVMNVWGAFIFIPSFSIYFSLHFLRHWRKSELEVERYQKESIRSQLNQLRSHLDPHFLFNNLNILSALVDQDPARSKLFIENFATVYRNLLRATTSGDLISLREEIEFIESYMFLLRTRFGQNIVYTVNIKAEKETRFLPPATVQMLIENAIKHNLITDAQPLIIELLQFEDDYLIVRNTLNARKLESDREGSGLDNIRKRYAHFTDRKVIVVPSETHFEVHIPLLEMELI